jgi:hypothetical protein
LPRRERSDGAATGGRAEALVGRFNNASQHSPFKSEKV